MESIQVTITRETRDALSLAWDALANQFDRPGCYGMAQTDPACQAVKRIIDQFDQATREAP